MAWQILELQKRFVNRNYILNEIIGNMVTHYCFHEENLRNYPMNGDISLNWCRGFYHNAYEPFEKYVTTEMFNRIAAGTLAGHNISSKGVIPSMTLSEFMEEMKKPVEHDPYEETCGATPAGYIPPITSEDWPVEIEDYFDGFEQPIDIDSDTNFSRYGGMKKAIGVDLDEKDYDMTYNGVKGSESFPISENNNNAIDSNSLGTNTSSEYYTTVAEDGCNGSCRDSMTYVSSTNLGVNQNAKEVKQEVIISSPETNSNNFNSPSDGGSKGFTKFEEKYNG